MPRFSAVVTSLEITGKSLWRGAAIVLLVTLTDCSHAALLSPADDMTARQRDLIIIATRLTLLIIAPMIVLTSVFT